MVTTSLRHSTTAVIFCPQKLPHEGHPIIVIDLTPTCIIATATGTGHAPPITDAAKGTTLIGQDHTIDPSMTEDPVTTRGMHPTLYLITTAILKTPLQTANLEDTPAGITTLPQVQDIQTLVRLEPLLTLLH